MSSKVQFDDFIWLWSADAKVLFLGIPFPYLAVSECMQFHRILLSDGQVC